jgi:hypothetical protein
VRCERRTRGRRAADDDDGRTSAPRGRRSERRDTVNGLSTVLIVVGLFLIGGIISFVKQKMPTSLIVLLSIGAAMCLVAGVMRLEVWN